MKFNPDLKFNRGTVSPEQKVRFDEIDTQLDDETRELNAQAEKKANNAATAETGAIIDNVQIAIARKKELAELMSQKNATTDPDSKQVIEERITKLRQQERDSKKGRPETGELKGREESLDLSLESEEADALYQMRRENVYAALRVYLRAQKEIVELTELRNKMVRSIKERKGYTHATEKETTTLEEISNLIESEEEKIKITQETPDGYYAIHYAELKEYREALDNGRLVETASVKKSVQEVLNSIEQGQPVFIQGDLGSGKTELAYHVSRTYLGKEPLIISGRKDISEYELFAHNVLSTSGVIDEEKSAEHRAGFLRKLEAETSAWQAEHPESTEEQKNQAYQSIQAALVVELENTYAKQTVSDIHLGAIYQAMEKGVPVIIDEANAIPHEMLIGLNHLLTRRAGQEVEVQQDSGKKITIAPGFSFIFTGNINIKDDQYVGRQELDPAFLSRLHIVHHDYPPQATDVAFSKLAASHAEARENNVDTVPPHEIFDIAVSMMMDGVGKIKAPEGSLSELWELAKVAKVFQDNFSRKNQDSKFFVSNGNTPIAYQLKKSVLSIRGLKTIIDAWKGSNFEYPLGYHLWHNFINQATVPQDKAFMYAYVKQNGGLFDDSLFTEKGSPFTDKGAFNETFTLEYVGGKQKDEKQTLTPRQIINILYGKGPERSEYPVIIRGGDQSSQAVSAEENTDQEKEHKFQEARERLKTSQEGFDFSKNYFEKRCANIK